MDIMTKNILNPNHLKSELLDMDTKTNNILNLRLLPDTFTSPPSSAPVKEIVWARLMNSVVNMELNLIFYMNLYGIEQYSTNIEEDCSINIELGLER